MEVRGRRVGSRGLDNKRTRTVDCVLSEIGRSQELCALHATDMHLPVCVCVFVCLFVCVRHGADLSSMFPATEHSCPELRASSSRSSDRCPLSVTHRVSRL